MMARMGNRRLGSSALEVGSIGYGCWRLAGTGIDEARAKIEAALDHGMTLIDTADIYGIGISEADPRAGFGDAEELLGRVLTADPSLRDRMVLATKGGIDPGVPYDSSARYLRQACEGSLRRLGVEVIDLYQIHRPDLLTHPAEVASALIDLRDSGKVREIGVSNYSSHQVSALRVHLGSVDLVSTQPELSLLHLGPVDDGTLDDAMANDITPLAWSPLGGGRLVTGNPRSPLLDVIDELANGHGVTRAAIALAWVMAHPSRPVPIVGTQQVDRIVQAAAATEVDLSRSNWYRLTAAAGRELP